MTTTELLEIINTILTNNDHPPVSEISGTTRLREDLKMDSFNLAEMAVRIESVTGIDVFGDKPINTVNEIIELVGGK